MVIAFASSILMYQRLINEGSALADNQCLKVNPIIIERKEAYINSLTALKANDSVTYEQDTDHYLDLSRKYVTEQTKWLGAEKAYIDRWDFQLFVPSDMKEMAITQFVSRAADTESTKALIEAFKVKDLSQSLMNEHLKKSADQVKIRNEADDKYNELLNGPRKYDWRTTFITVPSSKCPKENYNIPDVNDIFYPPSFVKPNVPLG